jgi:hypothetical protein
MQPSDISIDIESSTTSAETTTDGEMLSGSSLACLHKLAQAHFIPRVEARLVRRGTEIFGIFAGSQQATTCPQAELSGFQCRQSESPNVYVLALIARVHGRR